jgi:hypothetical protein
MLDARGSACLVSEASDRLLALRVRHEQFVVRME